MAMKSPPKPTAKGGEPLPPGARNVPGSKAYRALQGAPHPGEVTIGPSFLDAGRGGPELVIGKKHVHVEGDKKPEKR